MSDHLWVMWNLVFHSFCYRIRSQNETKSTKAEKLRKGNAKLTFHKKL